MTDARDRIRQICTIIGNTPCSDGDPHPCTPDSCYISELLLIGRQESAQPELLAVLNRLVQENEFALRAGLASHQTHAEALEAIAKAKGNEP